MYNPENRQYILKNSLGISYHVYFEEGRGLCIRMLSDSKIWSRGYVLDKSAINDFAAALDKNDVFHFFYQTRDGSLNYGHGMHGQIETRPVLNSRDPVPWTKHVSLILLEKATVFFYVLRYQSRHIISMQTIQNGKLSRPVAIDYVENACYRSIADHEGKCHLFYAGSDGLKNHLYHRTMKEDLTGFNPPERIFSTEFSLGSVSATCTGGNKIHVSFGVSGDGFYEILYKNLAGDREAISLYKGENAPGHSGLVCSGGTVYFFRAADGNLYFRSSENDGQDWTNEAPYPIGNNIVCFSYASNHKDENIFPGEIPGNFTRGYKLAFLEQDRIKPVNVKKPQTSTETEILNGLETKILQLQKHLDNIQNNIQKEFDNLQNELTKLWLTQKSFEKKLIYLDGLYAELQDRILYEPEENKCNKKIPPSYSSESFHSLPAAEEISREDA
ncbi:hypothetical protein ODU73_000338 [Thermoclostridium stercorarium]|jgi:hypothetical protein|nr:hypothetical protein [Thermoclostridium stercorarium]AGI38424.1 hypothetical protein Clst_0321 [Thermoclostridium stercorarium subsp. stercorarium DSM 8532]UZQ85955.1 hypothetical protein ODU73_000338 [Thermoclostridium stercorarium]